jgi:hypothetical protein
MKLTLKHAVAAIFLMLSFAPPVAASAKDVMVGSTSLNLTIPAGSCVVDEDADRVKAFRSFLAATNQLLVSYAACQSNSSLSREDFAHYSVPVVAINVTLPADTIKQVCAVIRAKGDKKLARILQERALDFEKAFDGLKISETRSIGVVAEDSVVCYMALVQKLTTGGGIEKIFVGISATMNIKGKLILYNLYSPYVSSDTVTTMLERHKSNVSAFFAANRN